MKPKILFIAGACTAICHNTYAKTENTQPHENTENIIISEDLNSITYDGQTYSLKQDNKTNFFIGLETPLISYTKVKISDDTYDISAKSSEFNLNKDILDNLSLNFGFITEKFARVSILINQKHQEIDNTVTSAAAYSFRFDVPIQTNTRVIPFLRLGIGYISAEAEDDDFSAVALMFGFGGNYSLSEKTFSYFALNYTFLPKADIDYIDEYNEHNVSFSVGLGYKF